MKLTVDLEASSYPIYIENRLLKNAASYIETIFTGKRIMIISDDNVYPLYGEKLSDALSTVWDCHSLVLPHGESTKDFQSLPRIYDALLAAGISRSDLVIALGGGVIGDLAGFAASSFLRGVRLVQIPTSLLAQVDSSVGGKVAVDLHQGKNLVGAFFQPSLVLIDPTVLDTLPERFRQDGMGEVIKYGCIRDAGLFRLLSGHTSFEDLREDLGDIIEQHFQYERESHGEAVAIGMYQICRMAEEKGLTRIGTAEEIRKLLDIYGLPHACGLPLGELTGAITRDKKNLGGHLNLILLHEIGDSYIYPADAGFFEGENRTV